MEHSSTRASSKRTVDDRLLYRIADSKAEYNDGRTPLHDAARVGLGDSTFHRFISHGADVEAVDNDGRAPLHDATRVDLKESSIDWLTYGVGDIKTRDNNGRTRLHNTARAGLENIVLLLISHGADVKVVDNDGRTPLHDAAYAGLEDSINEFISHGADIKAVDNYGRTPLHDAARVGSGNTVGQLIAYGADIKAVDNYGRTPLHDAARSGLGGTVNRLISCGADIKAVDNDGRTPLHDAARAPLGSTIHLLVNGGANVKAVDNNGRTPLHDAALARSRDTIFFLISRGADIKAVDNNGRTPLHDAARAGLSDIINWLISRGADVKVIDNNGRTPLHDAARAGLSDIISWFISHGADIEAIDNNGRTPLHDAALAGSRDTIFCLISHGADVKVIDNDGRTPLHDAVSPDLQDLVCVLIHLDADVHGLNEDGLLALQQYHSTCNFTSLISSIRPLPIFSNFIVQHWNLCWDGSTTYKECNGSLGDVLTISRMNRQGHSYIARSVSEYLTEFYPGFGLHLLEWIEHICEASVKAIGGCASGERLCPQSSNLRVPRYGGPRESATTSLPGSASDYQDEVMITGLSQAQKLTLVVSAESEASMLEMKSALAWILAVLQPRPKNVEGLFYLSLDQNSLDKGIPKPAEFTQRKSDCYCWMELFSYAVVVDVPPRIEATVHSETEGLELELNLLVELAAVDREIEIMNGVTMMYGFDTAIFPLEPAEARRWHFMTTDGRQITRKRAENELVKRKLDAKLLANKYLSGKVYVGWCPNPVVNICSKIPNTSACDTIRASGVPLAESLEEKCERSSAKDLSFSSRIGFLGSSLGFSGGAKGEKKYRRIVVVAKRTKEKNFEGVLSAAMTTPSILWDNREKRAWLLPVISALAFASLCYIEWQKYTFQKEENGTHEETDVKYCPDTKNTGSAAQTFLRRNSFLMVHTADGEPLHEPPTFEDIVRNIWEGMCDGEDLCTSELSGSNLEDKDGIFGYDLCEAMCQRRVQLRKLQNPPASGSWLPLCKAQRVQVIFCQHVGEVLRCYCSTANGFMRPAQAGILACLLDDFRSLYGARWSMLPEDASDFLRGLPIGEKFEWIPKGYDSGLGLVHCSHGSLQSITEKQNRKIQRKNPGVVSQGRLVGASTIHLPRDPYLIYFG